MDEATLLSILDGSPAPWSDLFQCGRVCLFGEHSDWSASHRAVNPAILPGRNIVCPTDTGLHARWRRTEEPVLILRTRDDKERVHGPVAFPLEIDKLKAEAKSGSFWAYACGTAAAVLEAHADAVFSGGLSIDVTKMDLPLKKGLSSSAAVCVLVARAFSEALGLSLDVSSVMDLAYKGERLTPSLCGRMDQACAYSAPIVMTYEGEVPTVETLQVGAPIYLVLVDLCATKDTVEILSTLQSCFPFPKTEDEKGVMNLLGPINMEITAGAMKAMAEGDLKGLGSWMTEAQSKFDDFAAKVCPSQLTAPVLHKVLAHPPLQPLVHGGKGVGAGGDGTAQFVARSEADQAAIVDILTRDFGMPSFPVTIKPTTAVDG